MSAKEKQLKRIKDEAIDTANHEEVKRAVDVSSGQCLLEKFSNDKNSVGFYFSIVKKPYVSEHFLKCSP
jgi:hypothetical protein